MIFAIDHIVFGVSPEQSRRLRAKLVRAGFTPEPFALEFPEIGAASESVSFAGGGFIEFVAAFDESLAPPIWFADIPRVIGLGFSSDDFDADTNWSAETGAWVMNEDHRLPDGSRLSIHAAGPHAHFSEFYAFVMDRPDGHLQFPERKAGPRLRSLSFAGETADLWRERFSEWFRLPSAAGSLAVGDVELRFEHRREPGIRVTPRFNGASRSESVELTTGSIELVASAKTPITG